MARTDAGHYLSPAADGFLVNPQNIKFWVV